MAALALGKANKLIIIILTLLTSCMMSRTLNNFKTDIDENFKKLKLSNIGVYVFSDGIADDKMQNLRITKFNRISYSYHSQGVITSRDFVDEITLESYFYPDTSNAGPSIELAEKVSKELKVKGYNPEICYDLGHNSEDLGLGEYDGISVDDVISHAKSKNLEAVFIVYYSCLSSFLVISTSSSETPFLKWESNGISKVMDGFLYLPSVVIIDLKDSKIVWSYSNYGIPKNVQYFNSGRSSQDVISGIFIEYTGLTYYDASVKAKEMIFEPKYWPNSYKPVPDLKQRRRKL